MSESSGKGVAAVGRSGRLAAKGLAGSSVKAYAIVDRNDGKAGSRAIPLAMEPPDDPFSSMYIGTPDGKADDTTFIVPREPPVAFADLIRVYQESCILPQCGDAVAEFVEGQGYDLQEVEGVKVDERPAGEQQAARREKRLAESFLRSAGGSAGQPCRWTRMLRNSRQDYEPMGWRAFELLCTPTMPGADPLEVDPLGTPVGINHIEAAYLRWCEGVATVQCTDYAVDLQYDDDPEAAPVPVYEPRLSFRQFRMLAYWRDTDSKPVYFRQFGDPRIIHKDSGVVMGRMDRTTAAGKGEAWRRLLDDQYRDQPEEDVGPTLWANELVIQSRYAPQWTPYGRPWWYGVSTVSEGLAAAEEANYSAIHDPRIPRVIITSEGEQTEGDSERLQEQIGQRDDPSAHSDVLLIENRPFMVGDESTGDARAARSTLNVHQIQVLPDDGLFTAFDNQGRTKVRSARGLSSMSVGLSDEYTFASARAALMVEDPRVYAPEREELDDLINQVLARRRVRWWRYVTRRAQIVSPDEAAKVVEQAEAGGGLTPNVHRGMAARTLGVTLPRISEAWGDQPFEVTKIIAQALGGLPAGGQASVPGEEGSSAPDEVAQKGVLPALPASHPVTKAMVNLRDALVAMRQAGGGT